MSARVTNLRPESALPRSDHSLMDWVPIGRRLILVDIENLVGGSHITADIVTDAFEQLRSALGPSPHDVWTTACGPTLLAAAMSVFPSRVLLGRGKDGADHRLVDCLHPGDIIGRYESIVLASGDAVAFAEPVRQLAARGVPTDVFVGAGFIGADLYRAARSVISTRPSPVRAAA